MSYGVERERRTYLVRIDSSPSFVAEPGAMGEAHGTGLVAVNRSLGECDGAWMAYTGCSSPRHERNGRMPLWTRANASGTHGSL